MKRMFKSFESLKQWIAKRKPECPRAEAMGEYNSKKIVYYQSYQNEMKALRELYSQERNELEQQLDANLKELAQTYGVAA